MSAPLRDSIKKTLNYFDLADYPLTREELFWYLWQPPVLTYDDFCLFLANENNSFWETAGGYYFLTGRSEIVKRRQERLWPSELKLKKALAAAKKILSVPFIRAVFVCNSVGMGQAEDNSDIDFLIITAPERIWLVRFFTNFILRLWGKRTYGAKVADRVCLSFYLDEKHLSLSNYRAAEDDIHFAYWIHQMIPIFDPQNIYQKFLESNNWVKKYLPYISNNISSVYVKSLVSGKISNGWRRAWERVWTGAYGDFLESQARVLQWQKMKLTIKENANKGENAIVIKEGIIKLHENDRRRDYRSEWQKKNI